MKINAIITGSTGMVGEGVLHECLLSNEVEKILVINRKTCNINNPKLIEILHEDFFNLETIKDLLIGYNACFFNLGVSSVGMKPDLYYHLTYELTLNFAKTVSELNPKMTFCYVSGAGTDSTEKGRINWARVKGKTENDLLKLPFKQAFMFRPGFIKPTKGLKNTYTAYKILGIFFPLFRVIMPKYIITLREIGLAMINSVINGYDKKVLECVDIRKCAQLK
jgi:uncharacterized protein YbjT (DUF2867 family)